MFRAFRAWLGLAGLLAFAAFTLSRVVPAVDASLARIRHAGRNARQTEDAVLARIRSPEYVAALRRVRETVPEDAAYFLVPTGAGRADYFLRFDLAPRRPILFEKVGESPASALSEGSPSWFVLARIDPPGPEVFTTEEFIRERSRR